MKCGNCDRLLKRLRTGEKTSIEQSEKNAKLEQDIKAYNATLQNREMLGERVEELEAEIELRQKEKLEMEKRIAEMQSDINKMMY